MFGGGVVCLGSGKEAQPAVAPGRWRLCYLHRVVSEIALSVKKEGMKNYMGVLYGLILEVIYCISFVLKFRWPQLNGFILLAT